MSHKLFIITVVIFLALAFSMFLFIDSFSQKTSEATGLVVDSGSFPTYLETSPIIESLPKSAKIGVKIGDASYEINGRNVYSNEDLSNKDIIFSLPQGYESVIGELGLCNAMKKANEGKELKVQTYLNKPVLLLKYRNLLKYGDCLE